MYLTISSVLTVCIFISIVALVLLAVFKSEVVLKQIGPNCMMAILLLVVVRMLFPLEFWFTYSVRVEEFFPELRMVLIHPVITTPYEVTVWHLLCFIWAVGIFCILIYKFISYRKIMRYISLLPKQAWNIENLQGYFARKIRLKEVKVTYSKTCKTPFLIGIKTPCVVLPEFPYREQQIRYIVLHEIMHIFNKDIVWEVVIDLLCTVFWWNPVFKYLRKELFRLIEMRNDMRIVAGLSEEESVQYMECLKDVALHTPGKEAVFGVAFSKDDFEELKKRMKLIAYKKSFCRWKQVLGIVMTCACLFLTTTVIFEPFKLVDEEEEEGVPLTANNTYLIINGDQYDVYIDGEYLFSTDDLSSFPGVNIYKNTEEAEKNE